MAQRSTELAYAPAPSWSRRRVFRRFVLPVSTVLVAGLLWRYGPSLVEHVQVLESQRRTLGYAPPPGRVIYDNDPQRVPGLLQDPAYVSTHTGLPKGAFALYDNPVFQTHQRRGKSAARPVAPAAFMGRLTSPAGNTRLVAVQWTQVPPGDAPFLQFALRPTVEVPARLFAPGRSVPLGSAAGLEMFVAPGDRTRIVEGQRDPADPSHFTIDYVHNGVPGTIDGWLNDDDTVTLGPRAGEVLEHNATYHWWSPAAGLFPPHIYQNVLATRIDPTTQPVLPKRDNPRFK